MGTLGDKSFGCSEGLGGVENDESLEMVGSRFSDLTSEDEVTNVIVDGSGAESIYFLESIIVQSEAEARTLHSE